MGVDTHKDVHVAAVLTSLGVPRESTKFPATTAGYQELLAWVCAFGILRRAEVECTGLLVPAHQARHRRRRDRPHTAHRRPLHVAAARRRRPPPAPRAPPPPQRGTSSRTTARLDPTHIPADGEGFRFLLQLQLPRARSLHPGQALDPSTRSERDAVIATAADGSRAEAFTRPEPDGLHQVIQSGPRRIWHTAGSGTPSKPPIRVVRQRRQLAPLAPATRVNSEVGWYPWATAEGMLPHLFEPVADHLRATLPA